MQGGRKRKLILGGDIEVKNVSEIFLKMLIGKLKFSLQPQPS